MTNVGLVSISFRALCAEDIVKNAALCGLKAIEWGGDVHAPHGDVETARSIRLLSDAHNIAVSAYGSYYRIGASAPTLWDDVLRSADALGTDRIRVWGSDKSSESLSDAEYDALVKDARRICDATDKKVCLECHKYTVTDEYHASLAFLRDVDRDNLRMFWQPHQDRTHAYNCDAVRALLPYVECVHVFSWKRDKRYPLAAMATEWQDYLAVLKEKELFYMLEFMHDDRIESLGETAETLRSWLL